MSGSHPLLPLGNAPIERDSVLCDLLAEAKQSRPMRARKGISPPIVGCRLPATVDHCVSFDEGSPGGSECELHSRVRDLSHLNLIQRCTEQSRFVLCPLHEQEVAVGDGINGRSVCCHEKRFSVFHKSSMRHQGVNVGEQLGRACHPLLLSDLPPDRPRANVDRSHRSDSLHPAGAGFNAQIPQQHAGVVHGNLERFGAAV